MKHRIGLDFGTSFSFPAIVNNNVPQSLLPSNANHGIPSVFFHDGERSVYGRLAQDYGKRRPDCMVTSVKQKLNVNKFTLSGREFTPKQVAAQIIEYVLSQANTTLEANFGANHATEAVIAVPVVFGDAERTLIKAAAELSPGNGGAGIKVLELIPEPVAAAIDYFGWTGATGRILVYDLGGGTFDVALVERDDNGRFPYKVVDQDGRKNLGGDKWDDALREHLKGKFRQNGVPLTNIDKRTEQLLLEEARDAKIRLSEEMSTPVELQLNGMYHSVDIAREEFERVTHSLLADTISCVNSVVMKNNLKGDNDLCVVLVGGSSYMPQVKEALRAYFGSNTAIRLHRPEMAIAYGAAMYAAGVKVQPISSFTYGVNTNVTQYDKEMIANMIMLGTPLPREVERDFWTREEGQTIVGFNVYEHRNTEEFTELSAGRNLMGVTIGFGRAVPKGTRVTAKMRLTESGLLELKVVDPATGNEEKKTLSITRVP
jgi:molecular chaperone DnaK